MRSTFGTYGHQPVAITTHHFDYHNLDCSYYAVKAMLDVLALYKVDRKSFEQVMSWLEDAEHRGFPIEACFRGGYRIRMGSWEELSLAVEGLL